MNLGLRLLTLVLLLAPAAYASNLSPEAPVDTSYCEIQKNPAAYNHKLVRVAGFVTHGFENFHFVDPTCEQDGFSIWLTYGGTTGSVTMYCCPGDSEDRKRSNPLKVEGIPTIIRRDPQFELFYKLLETEPDTTVRATIVGRFFSGRKESYKGGTMWEGFGHEGCCSLLVIESIGQFMPHSPQEFDYSSTAGWYASSDLKMCTMQYLRHASVNYGATIAMRDQREAESSRPWAFTNPDRVARQAVANVPGSEKAKPMRLIERQPGKRIYRWWLSDKEAVTVAVTRPYWISFYANKSDRVAWIATYMDTVTLCSK